MFCDMCFAENNQDLKPQGAEASSYEPWALGVSLGVYVYSGLMVTPNP